MHSVLGLERKEEPIFVKKVERRFHKGVPCSQRGD